MSGHADAFIAVDLGAGSGRVLLALVEGRRIRLEEMHRFVHPARREAGRLRWPFAALLDGVCDGIRRAARRAYDLGARLHSAGVDSWGVDYGWIDAQGRLLADPVCYRDDRTAGVAEEVERRLGRGALYARTGIQTLPFNTLYQLVAEMRSGERPAAAHRLLMIPDLVHHALGALPNGERTNASTTQLLSASTRDWDAELAAWLGLDAAYLPPLVDAGDTLGAIASHVCHDRDLPGLPLVAPATHDTASAVCGAPLQPGWAYISSGTWSLVGVELDRPVLDAAAAEANLTNEGGAFGTIRLLKNVAGMWALERCREEWARAGSDLSIADLVARAAACPRTPGLVDPDDPRFFNPPSMTEAISTAVRMAGGPEIREPGEIARVWLDSLALRYREVVGLVARASGVTITGIRVVGGGSKNAYLNQATADACGVPVAAGPVEATAAGNAVVQAIAAGVFEDLRHARTCMAASIPSTVYEPRDTDRWHELAASG